MEMLPHALHIKLQRFNGANDRLAIWFHYGIST
jgi:hypothetical protein